MFYLPIMRQLVGAAHRRIDYARLGPTLAVLFWRFVRRAGGLHSLSNRMGSIIRAFSPNRKPCSLVLVLQSGQPYFGKSSCRGISQQKTNRQCQSMSLSLVSETTGWPVP